MSEMARKLKERRAKAEGVVSGWMDDGWMNGGMDRWMDEWMDEWMDGWRDGCIGG